MASLYIHIPFCQKKCLYCSFVVSIGQEEQRETYVKCLDYEFNKLKGVSLNTIYIGGGTPSYLTPAQMHSLFRSIKTNFNLGELTEFVFELNPEDVDVDKLKVLKDCGISRISFGAQSMNDERLKSLGRVHDSTKVKEAYGMIRREGFDNVNVDLIFSLPNQTLNELRSDVRQICELGSDHLSIYSLMIEKNSYFFKQNIDMGSLETQAEYYKEVCSILGEYGFEQYEISNFSKKGKESKHNMNYWTGGNYYGVGIGAHSHVDGKRYWNVPQLSDYMEKINSNESVEDGFELLNRKDQFIERILLGLRMNVGVDMSKVSEEYQCEISDEMSKQINGFIDSGLLVRENTFLKATDRGRLVLDEISAKLF